jgi:hypothetical protein
MEFADPEISDIQVTEEGEVTAMVTITRTCADCGSDLKNAELEMTVDLSKECEGHVNKEGEETYDLTIEENDVNQIEESGGRYKKAYFGAEVCFTITCTCDKEFSVEGSMSDKVAASEMEECC